MNKIISVLLLMLCISVNAQNTDSVNNARMNEAWQYLKGTGGKQLNPLKALEIYKQCAGNGSAKAMNAIGMQYKLGLGVDTNATEAINWFQKSGTQGYAKAWYNLGVMYKFGIGDSMDYAKAYTCFSKAADLQEPLGWYAQGYMLYKGLGCNQDYTKAVAFFKKGALAGKASCMYFLGLCWRNGYGIAANADSATYWLSKAAYKGYMMADDELATKEPENSKNVDDVINQIKAVQFNTTATESSSIGKYTKVIHSIPANEIDGVYSGYLIRYDWSGQHPVQSSKLNLSLSYTNGALCGQWVEDDTITVALKATLTSNAIVFKNTQYSITDHYSPSKPIVYNFENARLQYAVKGDSVFLAGNLQMFSPDRKEPQKPLYVALIRSKETDSSAGQINFADSITYSMLQAYPNPFNDIVTIAFELKETCQVHTQLLALNGNVLYNNAATTLTAGSYTLPLQFKQLPSGMYILKLQYGKQVSTAKVIKQ